MFVCVFVEWFLGFYSGVYKILIYVFFHSYAKPFLWRVLNNCLFVFREFLLALILLLFFFTCLLSVPLI